MFPSPTDLQEMIVQAMEALAPAMHRRLQSDRTLAQVVQARAEAAQESYLEAVSIMPMSEQLRIQELPYLEQVAARENRSRAAREEAIAQALEFPSEDESTSQPLDD